MPYADGDGKVHIDDCLLRNVVREAEDTARRALRFRDPPRGGGHLLQPPRGDAPAMSLARGCARRTYELARLASPLADPPAPKENPARRGDGRGRVQCDPRKEGKRGFEKRCNTRGDVRRSVALTTY